jgi:hypothetical protein
MILTAKVTVRKLKVYLLRIADYSMFGKAYFAYFHSYSTCTFNYVLIFMADYYAAVLYLVPGYSSQLIKIHNPYLSPSWGTHN